MLCFSNLLTGRQHLPAKNLALKGPKISKENFSLLKFRFGIQGTWSQNRDCVWIQIGFLASWTSPNQKLSTRLSSWLSGKESACTAADMGQSLVWKDPTSCGATKPMQHIGAHLEHSYWACALEPGSRNYWSHMPQLQSTRSRVLPNEKNHYNEEPAHHKRVVPICQTREKPVQQQRPGTVKKERRMNE